MLGNSGKQQTFLIDAQIDLTPGEQIGANMIRQHGNDEDNENDDDKYEHVGHRCGKATHMIIALHGLMGDGGDLDKIVDAIVEEGNKSDTETGYIIVRPTTNETGTRTLEGTQACALRALKPVLEVLEAWPELAHVSVVAHGYGGVYGRALLKLMADRMLIPGSTDSVPNTPARLTPEYFIGLGVPFLGLRKPQEGWQNWGNVLMQKSLPLLSDKTGNELILQDKRNTLYQLATEREYIEPLRQFNRRILYANAYNDSFCNFSTSCIEGSNPHELRDDNPIPLFAQFPSIIGQAESELQLSRVTRDAFLGDEKREILLEMLASLNTLSWTKYHLKVSGHAHTNMLGTSIFKDGRVIDLLSFGRDIPVHVAQQIFAPSLADPAVFAQL